jgi:hypothetical protein
VAELFGLSTRVLVLRKLSELTKRMKDKEVDAGLQVKEFVLFILYYLFCF